MPDPIASSPPLKRRSASGAALLMVGGLATAFGLAACCALPLLFATLGVGTAWLSGVALIASPHRLLLMIVAAGCLIGGAVLLLRQQRVAAACGPNGVCTPPAVRALTFVGLIIGVGLLWAGYAYA